MCVRLLFIWLSTETVSDGPLAASRVIGEAFSNSSLAFKSVGRWVLWDSGMNWPFDFIPVSFPIL